MDKKRPSENEYSTYYHTYIGKVVGNDIIQILKDRKEEFVKFLKSIPEDKWLYKYGVDKWTIKEAVMHVIDTERIFAYRALRASRKDPSPMAGFEQDDYVPNSDANNRSANSIIQEFSLQRDANIAFLENINEEMATYQSEASGLPVTARSLAYMIAGHEIHHHHIIEERYL